MISPRTHEGRWHRVTVATGAIALLAAMTLLTAQASPSTVRDRIRDTGTIRLGYRVDARPFSYSEAGRSSPTGYSVSVCQAVVDAITRSGQVGTPQVEWVMVAAQDRFRAVQNGTVDLLCGADTVTLDPGTYPVRFGYAGGPAASVRVRTTLQTSERHLIPEK